MIKLLMLCTSENEPAASVVRALTWQVKEANWTVHICNTTLDHYKAARYEAVLAVWQAHPLHHRDTLIKWLKEEHDDLQKTASSLYIVTLGPDGQKLPHGDIHALVEEFLADSGWQPAVIRIQRTVSPLLFQEYKPAKPEAESES